MESKNRDRHEEEMRSYKEDYPPSSSSSHRTEMDEKPSSFSPRRSSSKGTSSSPIPMEKDIKWSPPSSSYNSSSAAFRINWMNMRDGGDGQILWSSHEWNEEMFKKEISAYIPKEILDCR